MKSLLSPTMVLGLAMILCGLWSLCRVGLLIYRSRRKAQKCSVMVSKDVVRQLDRITAFNWQRDYAPLWEGRNEGHLNDILFRPGPDDILTIDGLRAPFSVHLARAARKGTVQ
jgi:hypothetical protein